MDAALVIVDAEGVEGLTMPRLARQLNAGVMSLYRYVENKQELLDAVAMRAIAEVRLAANDPLDALGTLVGWGHGLRVVLLAHPGVADVLARQSVIGAGIFGGLERLLARLQAVDFAPERGVRAVYAVLIYTLGFTIWEAPRVRAQPESAYVAQWREGFARFPTDQFPRVEAGLATLGTVASPAQFEFGLLALVSGLVGQ